MKLKNISFILLGIVLAFILIEIILQTSSFVTSSLQKKDSFKKDDEIKILCLGDSYTYGLGVKSDQSYPAQLERLLGEKLRDDQVKVINSGRPGMNTPMLADQFQKILNKYKPDIVLVMIGANDRWNYEGFSSEPIYLTEKIRSFFYSLKTVKMFTIFASSFNNSNANNFKKTTLKDKKTNEKPLGKNMEEKRQSNYYYQALMFGNKYREKNDFNKAKPYYDYALSLCPDDNIIRKELTRHYKRELNASWEKLEIDEIKKRLDFIKKEGGFNKAYYYQVVMLGNYYRNNKNFKKAKLYYDCALEIDPSDQLAYQELLRYYKHNLLNVKHSQEDKKLLQDCIDILKSKQNNTIDREKVNNDIWALAKEGKKSFLPEESLLLITKMIYQYGLRDKVWGELDDFFNVKKDPDYAINYYKQLLKRFPENIDIYLRLSRQYSIVRDYEKVKHSLKNILRLDPKNKEARKRISEADFFIKQNLSRKFIAENKDVDLFARLDLSEKKDATDLRLEEENINLYENYNKLSKDRQNIINKVVYKKILKICDQANKKDVKMFFLGYPLITNENIKNAALKKNAIFVDFKDNFAKAITPETLENYFLTDGHCTAKGYKIIAEKLTNKIINSIKNDHE